MFGLVFKEGSKYVHLCRRFYHRLMELKSGVGSSCILKADLRRYIGVNLDRPCHTTHGRGMVREQIICNIYV